MYEWDKLTSPELQDLIDREAVRVAVLPVGAVEAHGPHLPLGTDSFLTDGVLTQLQTLHQSSVSFAVRLPLLPIGASSEHASFRGTLTLSDETLASLWMEVCQCVLRSGLRRLVIINGHGGQTQNVEILCRRLRFEHHALAIGVHLQRLWSADSLFPVKEVTFGIHGGAIETSAMMVLQSDLVRADRIADFPSTAQTTPDILPYGDAVMFGWRTEDLNQQGALGAATLATRDAGEELLRSLRENLLRALHYADQFDVSKFDDSGNQVPDSTLAGSRKNSKD